MGGVVGVRGGALVGFAFGMGVSTCDVGGCWRLLHHCCVYCVEWGQSGGGTGMARPEQRICGITVKCEGQVDAECGTRTIPGVIGCAGQWESAGARLLVVILISLGAQLVEVWLPGASESLSFNSANGLLLHVPC